MPCGNVGDNKLEKSRETAQPYAFLYGAHFKIRSRQASLLLTSFYFYPIIPPFSARCFKKT